MIVTEREREAETQAEEEAGSMYREPDVRFDPGSLGSRPGPKAGAKRCATQGIPIFPVLKGISEFTAQPTEFVVFICGCFRSGGNQPY